MLIRRNATLSPEALSALLQSGQNDQAAFLASNASIRSVAETLAALANTHGGVVVLGVNRRGVIQEKTNVEKARETAIDAGLQAEPPLILPSPQVIALEPGSSGVGEVVVITVPAGLPNIYSVKGRYLTRTGTQNRPLMADELRRLLTDRSETGFESTMAEGSALTDLDPKRIERYLERISAAPDEDTQQLLMSKGCLSLARNGSMGGEGQASSLNHLPTFAGLLLFGDDPQRFVRSAEIICVRYSGDTMSDEFVRQDISGPLPEQIRQAEAFVTGNMQRGMAITGLSRQETTEYPIAVVREAIVNAIAHRDYSIRGEGIRVMLFNDRLEVYSPGRLPGHVTLDNLIDERYSRNEAIVAVLTDMGYIERLGYGIDRMIATMKENGLPAPLFEETAAGFRVTLKSAGQNLVSTQPRQQPWQQSGPNNQLTARQQQALAYVQEHGRITNSDFLALVPDVSAETIRRELADLVNKNLLIRVGNKKATYYILK